ncbi:hypothetical protein [Iningainema tapete]|uniref:Uncharacterized protein n=1 Tax=Iningainema tapete BLCC-T55 TaxID=2748662 RepID=A0A8J6XCP2_9CYAN|nr:hypothetical protein [Iningainema tapete]MBD2770663.1 hypothetical protein [Iningainema tapete BLCC-T55]
MFTQEQLNFLIQTQSDDWTPTYFQALVQESSSDENLVNYITTLSLDQVVDLQLALDLLGSLPSFE